MASLPVRRMFRFVLQHDETARESTCVIEADSQGAAEQRVQNDYGHRWFIVSVDELP